MRKQMKTSSERVWKQTRVKLVVRKKHSSSSFVFLNGLVGRWRESLGDRQICSVSIQRAGKGDGVVRWSSSFALCRRLNSLIAGILRFRQWAAKDLVGY